MDSQAKIKFAVQKNAETIGVCEGYLYAAPIALMYLEQTMPVREMYELINMEDDLNIAAARKLKRKLSEACDDADSLDMLAAVMRNGDGVKKSVVDFTTDDGKQLAKYDGIKRAFRMALKNLQEWSDEDDGLKALQMYEHAVEKTKQVMQGWIGAYEHQLELAKVHREALEQVQK